MKKTTILMMATLAVTVSCNRNDKAIEQPAIGYISAMADYRVDNAYEYATPETQEQTLQYISNVLMPLLDSSYIAANTPAEIHIDRITMVSDTEAIVYYDKTTPIQKKTPAELNMRKRGDVWLAHQVIKHAPLLGGKFETLDTAALRDQSLAPIDSSQKRPTKIIAPRKKRE